MGLSCILVQATTDGLDRFRVNRCQRLLLFVFLLGLLPAFVLERFFTRQQEAMYLLLASIVLALEMLATNFAGLGDIYPQARDEADLAFSGFEPIIKTVLLDRYLAN